MAPLRHVRARWPEPEIPAGAPEWLFYELDDGADTVVRSVEVFPDGAAKRNSIEIEERGGAACPSLIDCSIAEGFEGTALSTIDAAAFEQAWARGVDTPVWNVRPPPAATLTEPPTELFQGRPCPSRPARRAPLTGLKFGLLLMLIGVLSAGALWLLWPDMQGAAMVLAIAAVFAPIWLSIIMVRGPCPNCGRETSQPYLSTCGGCGHILLQRGLALIDLGPKEEWLQRPRG